MATTKAKNSKNPQEIAEITLIDVYETGYRVNGTHHEKLLDLDFSGQKIILGAQGDPLFPFEAKFSNFLKLLFELGSKDFALLHLNTCSPLLLVAVPMLKNMRERLSVRLNVYQDDALIRKTNPRAQIPRKREVYQLASVLRQNSIDVSIKPCIKLPCLS